MVSKTDSFLGQFLDPVRLMGPIFDKELRISSRRRMSYLIRSAYCLCLGLYVVVTWAFVIRSGTATSSLDVARLSEVGKGTSTAIIRFQFFAMQLIAVLFLSTSVGDEIRKGTLSVLMTTPISRFQIIVGKLLSGLFQLVLLLGISLPLLAVIRVFGGVPWDRIVAGLFITLTAAILAGSVTLFLSVLCRHAYTVVLTAVVVYLVFFAALPSVLTVLAGWNLLPDTEVGLVTYLTNPFVALYSNMNGLSATPVVWPLHCVVVVFLSGCFVMLSILLVRRATLAQAFKRAVRSRRARSMKSKPITSSPIVWREMRQGMFGGTRSDRALFFLLIGTTLVIGVAIVLGGLRTYFLLTAVFMAIMLRVAVHAARAIAGEKEARTLPILLTTPLDDKRIVRDKALAVLYRNVPLLILPLLLYFGLMISVRALQAQAMIMMLIYVPLVGLSTVASMLFVTGSGVYFGSRLRTTTATLAATVGLYLAFYLVIIFGTRLLFAVVLGVLSQVMPGVLSIVASLSMSIVPMAFHAVAGIILTRRAAGRLRQNLF